MNLENPNSLWLINCSTQQWPNQKAAIMICLFHSYNVQMKYWEFMAWSNQPEEYHQGHLWPGSTRHRNTSLMMTENKTIPVQNSNLSEARRGHIKSDKCICYVVSNGVCNIYQLQLVFTAKPKQHHKDNNYHRLQINTANLKHWFKRDGWDLAAFCSDFHLCSQVCMLYVYATIHATKSKLTIIMLKASKLQQLHWLANYDIYSLA